MDKKWLRHPNLPEGQEIEVRADAARNYYMSGWVDMDAPQPTWRPEDDALAALNATPPSEQPQPTDRRSRRATSKKEDDQ
jgi:hypothetical protein